VGANAKALAKWILLLGAICAAWLLTTSDDEPARVPRRGASLRAPASELQRSQAPRATAAPRETKKRFLRQVQAAKALMEEGETSRNEPDEVDETGGSECRNHLDCADGFACREGRCIEVPDEPHRSLLEAERKAIQLAKEAEARARAKAETAKQETGTNEP